jgi:hypothetical protein
LQASSSAESPLKGHPLSLRARSLSRLLPCLDDLWGLRFGRLASLPRSGCPSQARALEHNAWRAPRARCLNFIFHRGQTKGHMCRVTCDAIMLSRSKAELRRGYMRVLRPCPDGLADEMLRAQTSQTSLPQEARENVWDGTLGSTGAKLLHSRKEEGERCSAAMVLQREREAQRHMLSRKLQERMLQSVD